MDNVTLSINYRQILFGLMLARVAKHDPDFKVPMSYRDGHAVDFWPATAPEPRVCMKI